MTRSGPRGSRSPLIEDVLQRFAGDRDLREELATFARAYLRRWPDLVEEPDPVDLAAEVRDVFAFAERSPADPARVRAFNPTPTANGYESAGGVVEVVAEDSPFLVDSITAEILDHGFEVVRVLHPVVGTKRDAGGRIAALLPARNAPSRESIQHYELDRPIAGDDALQLVSDLKRVLGDVRRSVEDFEQMQGAVFRMIKVARSTTALHDKDDIEEAVAFLEWLLDLNFVFLGFREYRIEQTPRGPALGVVPDSGLGILRDSKASQFAEPVPMADLDPDLRRRYEPGDLIVITKTNRPSTVHRRARMDYVGLRIIDQSGVVTGEVRLLGLFTSKAYMAAASDIPLLRRKLQRVVEAEDLIEGSHDHKLAVQLFESFPKDELFSTPIEEIRRSIAGLIELHERQQVRLFVRRDLLNRNVSVLVSLPRDRFNAQLRRDIQQLFKDRFGGSAVDYRLALGETGAARIHFTVWVGGGEVPDVSFEDLEAEVIALARTWDDRITELLVALHGPEQGRRLADRWCPRFPEYYKSATPLAMVAGDIEQLDRLAEQGDDIVVGLQNEPGEGLPPTHLAVYRRTGRLSLSAIMPCLEALGVRVVEEVPTRLLGGSGGLFIHDFALLTNEGDGLDLDECGDRVAAAVAAVLSGEAESDSLHRLLLTTQLDHGEIALLRAYRTYWQRVGHGFTLEYVNDALAGHPAIAARLSAFLRSRFHPDYSGEPADEIAADIELALDSVASLDEDRILRSFLALMEATVRTSAFVARRGALAFKFRSAGVPDMPDPKPLFEVFVTAPDVEGIHMRGGLVARGGIRWSDRREDYRTEVLGLVKAQMTKNALIVPTGAKGAFVLRKPPADPALVPEVVRSAYTTYIGALLDVTDNLVDGDIVHPEGIVIRDEPDPYLVVAADRGTASFSDLANEIAAERGFWLGDAFASGGSTGYDHKALGITARGAWESVKWHFRELGIDVAAETVSVIGIGDMSGDVFGNGMLLSPKLSVVAAFDHRHIFIDPDPDVGVAFGERSRLFALPRSSWADYDASTISTGGGVWPRSAKRLELSPEARAALGTDLESGTPADVVRAILTAPVHLLWNGGIGTFVRASDESQLDVGDRANDTVRVDATELRCVVVGEGGNLGFTQRARIEFAMAGGRINTDFIDNSGGVNCSDREVNLKILLRQAEERGDLTREERNQLITAVADDVVERILYDSFLQAQILEQEAGASGRRLEAYEDLMVQLEAEGMLDRGIERLPSTEEMAQRARSGQGLTAPELAVLLTYAKRSLRRLLQRSDLPDSSHFDADLARYFPDPVVDRFGDFLDRHPLRRDLIATIVANEVVNSEGITFVTRLSSETGAAPDDVVRAYRAARAVTEAGDRWLEIENLVDRLDPVLEGELLSGVDHLVEDTARWFLTHSNGTDITELVEGFQPGFRQLAATIDQSGSPRWASEREANARRLIDAGVPADMARRHAYQAELVHAPDIIEVATSSTRPVTDVARGFFLLGEPFGLDWVESQLEHLPTGTRWQRRAVEAVDYDLRRLRRRLAERILTEGEGLAPDAALDRYLHDHRAGHERLQRLLRSLTAEGGDDLSALVVAVQQIETLAG